MVSIPAPGATTVWPPDDTEESIVGVDRHQLDIITVRTGLNEDAYRLAAGGPLPWQAISQIMRLGCRRPDGTAYTVIPDVMVVPRPMDRTPGASALRQDGPPLLIVEVASEATERAALDAARGKAWSYGQAGVREYLVLDPSGQYGPELGRGWRRVAGAYQPWARAAGGRWARQRLPVALGVAAGLAAVQGAAGRRQLREGEIGDALRAQLAEGTRAAMRRLARRRFGVVAALESCIAAAGERELDGMLDRLLTAASPDDL